MKVNKDALELAMAQRCIGSTELCRRAGLGRATLYGALNGKAIRPATAGRIAAVLNINAADIVLCEK